MIAYIGGLQTLPSLPVATTLKQSNMLLLNVERVIWKLEQSRPGIVLMKSKEIWSNFMTDLPSISGHSSILLSDLNSILVMAGTRNGVKNKFLYMINSSTGSVR